VRAGRWETSDGDSSRRERSETVDGRCNPGHGKGSGGYRENSLHCCRRYYPKYGIHTFIAVERVLSFLDRPASAASDLLRLKIGWSRKLAAGVQGKPE
jgi:hypothetical protein